MQQAYETEMVVSEVNAVGCDKLLAYRVEGQVLSRRVEGVINRLLYNADLESKDPSQDGVVSDVGEQRAWSMGPVL